MFHVELCHTVCTHHFQFSLRVYVDGSRVRLSVKSRKLDSWSHSSDCFVQGQSRSALVGNHVCETRIERLISEALLVKSGLFHSLVTRGLESAIGWRARMFGEEPNNGGASPVIAFSSRASVLIWQFSFVRSLTSLGNLE